MMAELRDTRPASSCASGNVEQMDRAPARGLEQMRMDHAEIMSSSNAPGRSGQLFRDQLDLQRELDELLEQQGSCAPRGASRAAAAGQRQAEQQEQPAETKPPRIRAPARGRAGTEAARKLGTEGERKAWPGRKLAAETAELSRKSGRPRS
jgi:hypothetical protein